MAVKGSVAQEIDLSEFRRKPVSGCGFSRLDIKAEHVATLKAAMQAEDISGSSIHEWLKKRGYQISEESVRKHRKGTCSCLLTN
jgi:hypothetical protein